MDQMADQGQSQHVVHEGEWASAVASSAAQCKGQDGVRTGDVVMLAHTPVLSTTSRWCHSRRPCVGTHRFRAVWAGQNVLGLDAQGPICRLPPPPPHPLPLPEGLPWPRRSSAFGGWICGMVAKQSQDCRLYTLQHMVRPRSDA